MYTIETFVWLIMKTINNETAEKISCNCLFSFLFLGLIFKEGLNASKRDEDMILGQL